MTKNLSKEINTRSRFTNKFCENHTTERGIKSVRFSSKIKRKNQERFSVIYTELSTISTFHRTTGANQARRKRRSFQAGRLLVSWPSSNSQMGYSSRKPNGVGEGVEDRYGISRNSKRILKG